MKNVMYIALEYTKKIFKDFYEDLDSNYEILDVMGYVVCRSL